MTEALEEGDETCSSSSSEESCEVFLLPGTQISWRRFEMVVVEMRKNKELVLSALANRWRHLDKFVNWPNFLGFFLWFFLPSLPCWERKADHFCLRVAWKLFFIWLLLWGICLWPTSQTDPTVAPAVRCDTLTKQERGTTAASRGWCESTVPLPCSCPPSVVGQGQWALWRLTLHGFGPI